MVTVVKESSDTKTRDSAELHFPRSSVHEKLATLATVLLSEPLVSADNTNREQLRVLVINLRSINWGATEKSIICFHILAERGVSGEYLEKGKR